LYQLITRDGFYTSVSMDSRGRASKRQPVTPPPGPEHQPQREVMPVSNTSGANRIILIDREVYECLSPLHQAAADLLVAKGKYRIVEPGDGPAQKGRGTA
jgi:hypothetical protein